jgi:hypothetical protein
MIAPRIRTIMNRHLILCLSLPLMMAIEACGKQPEPAKDQAKSSILICEQASNRIMLMDSEVDWKSPDAVIWSWSPKLDPMVDDHQHSWFRSLDDAKPVRHGQQVVVTASGGGAALIDFESGRAVATVNIGGSPHSAELLPDGRVVVASSNGDKLSLWDPGSGQILQTTELGDAHGVEWDQTRKCLWALGGKQLICFAYQADSGTPRLEPKLVLDLPVTEASKHHLRHGGHDLTPIPGEDAYFVTDMDHLWRFDCKNETFTPLAQGHGTAKVKSISQLGKGGPILVLQATEKWYAAGPRTVDGLRKWALPEARIYKARWWLP